ncbi:2OG-Fe dioxygenase family protein [Nocardia sp. CDC159]|uniref:2OG-Fe dioxygenase family protein n=1 Tax=Nocardia pulmonis TaxID=2951408 RepID=A0A9X2E634_9NOCA|nr:MULTISPECIES: 2OG-Fe dioxygenase family protein [Nocardia]MCM6773505.1 2OG-Fe dioxygenase family protein [Nocardia pulmonis]MCM6786392.1 2OG-Fe dioxygenase family protein [Nocardia sp. CDC159]
MSAAREALADNGIYLMSAAETGSLLRVGEKVWERFGAHWSNLAVDHYARDRGTRRLRRYGCFRLTTATGRFQLLQPRPFAQPQNSNPLYIGVNRIFEPLTDTFVADPVFAAVLRLLAECAAALNDPPEWIVSVHPFRVIGAADADGLAAPEGRHRDGVTLVSTLLIARHNATGGESMVLDLAGRPLLTVTLDEPGTLLLADDRRTLHDVSPVRPADSSSAAYRDVLVTTFA